MIAVDEKSLLHAHFMKVVLAVVDQFAIAELTHQKDFVETENEILNHPQTSFFDKRGVNFRISLSLFEVALKRSRRF